MYKNLDLTVFSFSYFIISSRKTTFEQHPKMTSPIANGTFMLLIARFCSTSVPVHVHPSIVPSNCLHYTSPSLTTPMKMAGKINQDTIRSIHREVQHGVLPLQLFNDHSYSTYDLLMAVNKNGDTSFHVAARHGRVELLKILHEQYRVPLEHVNADGKTALHEAAQNSCVECVQFLITAGSQVDSLKRADWSVKPALASTLTPG